MVTMEYRIVSRRLAELAADGTAVVVPFNYTLGQRAQLPAVVAERIREPMVYVDPFVRVAQMLHVLQLPQVLMSKRSISISVCALVLPVVVSAQPPVKAPPGILPAAVQIASAISPLPEQFKESATVLGFQGDAKRSYHFVRVRPLHLPG
jgi:hypothetical protein